MTNQVEVTQTADAMLPADFHASRAAALRFARPFAKRQGAKLLIEEVSK